MPKKSFSKTEPAHSFLYEPSQLPAPEARVDIAAIQGRVSNYLNNPFNLRQQEAFAQSFERRLTLLWGPPGTGKTTVGAGVIMGWLENAWALGKPLCVCIGSSNYNAIDNVLFEVAGLLDRRRTIEGPYPDTQIVRVRSTSANPVEDPRIIDAERGSTAANNLVAEMNSLPGCRIVGGTWMQLLRMARAVSAHPIAQWFDLLLIDEASQVSVASAAPYLLLLKSHGHLMLTGDHKQLGPIYGFQMKDSNKGLYDCVFTYMQETHEVKPVALKKNYRTNDEIGGWPGTRFYKEGYEAFNPRRRLDIIVPDLKGRMPREWPSTLPWTSDFMRFLDPEWPVVVITYPPSLYTLSNQFEAQMVAALSYLYRQILKYNNKYPGDHDFWSKMLGIVTPHRAQMSNIRNLLVAAAGMPLKPSPFVDTVDRFQGQQRDLMIASYAVADRDFVASEEEFILSPRRFNVSLTRAKSKFIMFVSDAIIQHLPSDADVARDAAHLQLFVENYCNSFVEDIELPFLDNGSLRNIQCKLRLKTCQPLH